MVNNSNLQKLRELTEKLTKAEEKEQAFIEELEIRNRIVKAFLDTPDDTVFNKVLEIILEVTESKFGLFGYFDGTNSICPSITEDIINEEVRDSLTYLDCNLCGGKHVIFPFHVWKNSGASWAKSYQDGKLRHSNTPSKGIPLWHEPILRHITVPFVCNNGYTGILIVANKETDYTDRDIHKLQIIAGHIAPILWSRFKILEEPS